MASANGATLTFNGDPFGHSTIKVYFPGGMVFTFEVDTTRLLDAQANIKTLFKDKITFPDAVAMQLQNELAARVRDAIKAWKHARSGPTKFAMTPVVFTERQLARLACHGYAPDEAGGKVIRMDPAALVTLGSVLGGLGYDLQGPGWGIKLIQGREFLNLAGLEEPRSGAPDVTMIDGVEYVALTPAEWAGLATGVTAEDVAAPAAPPKQSKFAEHCKTLLATGVTPEDVSPSAPAEDVAAPAATPEQSEPVRDARGDTEPRAWRAWRFHLEQPLGTVRMYTAISDMPDSVQEEAEVFHPDVDAPCRTAVRLAGGGTLTYISPEW